MTAASSRQEAFWAPRPATLTFPAGHVDVWRVRLDEASQSDSNASILSPDESARARRFHFDRDRVHYIRCRSALRNLLGAYLTISAPDLQFEYLATGKPQLRAEQNPQALQFNLSHSGNLALIAIGNERKLGVDIEKIRSDVDTAALAERFFSARERAGLLALPIHLRAPAFFACWTRKEAFLKATGDGLSFPLADFSVTTDPDRNAELVEIRGDFQAGRQWLLKDLGVGDAYHATVACDRPHTRVETLAWN